MAANNTPLPDLVELSGLSQYTTYTTAGGGIIGLVDNATYTDNHSGNTATQITELNTTADADNGILTIDGVDYEIDLADPDNTSVTITDGSASQHIVSGDSGTSNVVFITAVPVGGGPARYFMVLDDWIGDIENISSIEIEALDTTPAGEDIQINLDQDNLVTVCFAAGTLIGTETGARPVESLRAGERVLTLDHGPRPLLWTHSQALRFGPGGAPDSQRPVRIRRGALGPGMPARDMRVSPQHRLLVNSRIAARLCGAPEVLVPAVKLLKLPGVTRDVETTAVRYHHLLFAAHEIIVADGAAAESLLPEIGGLRALPAPARAEISALVPAPMLPARPILDYGPTLRALLRRHRKNAKPLCDRSVLAQARLTPERPVLQLVGGSAGSAFSGTENVPENVCFPARNPVRISRGF